MLIAQMQKRGSVVVVESNESADIFRLPLTVNSSSRVESGTNLGWLSSVHLPSMPEMDDEFLREV
jgi:hypothetical protein